MRIDVFSDVVCPWCYLGTRRLNAALDRLSAEGVLGRDAVEVRWRAFELDPAAPSEPQPLRPVLERKYGPGAFDVMTSRLTALGAAEGIQYRFDLAKRVNTFDAHRLLAWSATQPAGQGALHDRLFSAYFTEGADVSDAVTLAKLAADVGLDGTAAAEVLASGGFGEEVRADEKAAREADITGVPAFIVDGRLLIPGAQEVDTMVRLLSRVVDRTDL